VLLCCCFAALLAQVSAILPDPFGGVAGKCTVRPETSATIDRLRAGAAKLTAALKHEVAVSEQRKRHIAAEQQRLNEQIRSLNQVKAELGESVAWMETTNQRLDALAQQEQLLTNKDVLECLEREKARFSRDAESRENAIAALMAATREAEDRLRTLPVH